MQINLKGHLALVTGATGELGQTITRTLARCGADVVIHFHQNQRKSEELLAEIKKMGVTGMITQADITSEESVEAMREAVQSQLGSPSLLVTNAVIQYQRKSILEQSLSDYESQFRSCVLHNVLMAKAFLPAMIARDSGRIIAINTECAMQALPSQSAYVSGKRGMDGFLRVLAREVGKHQITVNQVAPGWMISEKDRENQPERPGVFSTIGSWLKGQGSAGAVVRHVLGKPPLSEQDAYAHQLPLKHRGTDQDVANVVSFLASDLAGFITGAYIPVTGGNVMPAI